MKKLVAGSLACLISVSSNAANWLYVDTDRLGVDNYIDANSLRIVDNNAQIVTAFIKMKGIEKSNQKLKGSVISAASFKFAFDCRDETSNVLSSIFYNFNGVVIDSENKQLYSDNWQFTPLHPETSSYLNMYAACAIAGFKDISDLQ